jgi:hypothetical protein
MTLSLGRALSTLALTVGLAVATAGSASAEDLAVKDAKGDLVSFDMETETTTPAPEVKDADILRTVLRHNARRIVVRVKYAELRHRGQLFSQGIRIVTNEGVRREASIYAAPHMWRGQSDMGRPNGNPVDCAIKHAINYDTNVVTLSFPRSCVSDPRWVRLGVGAFWMDGQSNVYVDDALISGHINENNLKLSPRLRKA